MNRGPNFLDRETFASLMDEIERVDHEHYHDAATAYGDMSRLVVAWLATIPAEELRTLYNDFGWKGSANARPFHLAAHKWFEKYHPELKPPE
jgi:predicted oxidoreductase